MAASARDPKNNLGFMANAGGASQFVIDVVTKFKGADALKEAQTLEDKLNASLAHQLAIVPALGSYFTKLSAQLKNFSGLSWLGVAGGFALGQTFLNVAKFIDHATGAVRLFGRELYYMNRRLNEPGTRTLFNIAFAGSQIGLSPETVLGTTESMGAATRLNPGVAGLLSRFIPGYKAGGPLGGREQLNLVGNLKNRFGEGGYYMAAQFANMFGFNNELEFRTMWTNLKDLNDAYETHDRLLKNLNVDTDKTSKSFVELHRAWNNVSALFEAWVTKWSAWLADNFITPVLKDTAYVLSPSTFGNLAPKGNYATSPQSKYGAAQWAREHGTGHSFAYNAAIGTLSPAAIEDVIGNFTAMGLSRNAAIGFAFGLHGESGSKRGFVDYNNSNNLGGGHYGIMQWGKSRQAAFEKMFGHPLWQSTPQEQWKFLAFEAGGGDEGTYQAFNWAHTHPNATPAEATDVWNRLAERPGAAYGVDIYSGANQYASSHPAINQDNNFGAVTVNVHTNGDASGATGAALGAIAQKWQNDLMMSMRQAIRADSFR